MASVATTVNGQTDTRAFTYNSAGFLTAQTALGRTTTFAPTSPGNVASITAPGGRITTLGYDYAVVNGISSPGSPVIVSRGINADGTVAWESSTGVTQTSYGYDGAGRNTSVSWPAGGRTGITTAYTMSGGRWVSTTETRGSVWVRTHLDGFGRPRLVEDSTGVKSRTTYTAAGQVVAQSGAFGGSVAEAQTTFTYDGLGRVLTRAVPDGGWREWYYAASSVREMAGLTSSTFRTTWQHFHWFQPGDGPLWRLIDPVLGDWRYEYNGRGQLVHAWQAGSATVQSRGWNYNSHGELVTEAHSESGTTTYQYSPAGLLTYTQDSRGAAQSGTTYGYNGDYQLTSVNAPGTADDVTITYDTAGRQKTVTTPSAQTTFGYDTFSRATSRTDVIAGRSFTQAFVYNSVDSLVRIDYPQSGRKVFYDYNAQQRLTSVRTQIATGPITTLATSFAYSGDAAVASYTLGNGRTVSVQRDVRKRPTRWIDGPLDLTYTYDWVSNVKTIKDARDPGFTGTHSSQFSYDLLDRITQVVGFGATTFAYSEGGDRTQQGSIAFNYDTNRRLTSLSGGASGSFTYTANGSLLTDPTGASYTYTSQNQLKTSTLGGQATSYQYGGDGMRAIKTGPTGGPTLYVYGAGGGPTGEYRVVGGGVQIVREYVYLGSQLLTSFAPSVVAPPPLSVAIQTPASTSTVTRGQNVSLTATVSVGPGLTVSRVEYYTNGLLTGQAASGTYAVTLSTPYLPATSRIVARVVASNGQAVASAPVTLNVQ